MKSPDVSHPGSESAAVRTGGRRPLRATIAACIAAGAVIFGAVNVASAATAPTSPGKAGATSSGSEGMGPGGQGRGPGTEGTLGTVASVSDGTFTLSERGTTTVKVTEASSTVYLDGTTKVATSKLKQGEFVMVAGKKSSDGSVAATKVIIGNAPPAGKVGRPGGAPSSMPAA